MKKEGDRARYFLIHFLFVAVVVSSIYFIASSKANITGYATMDASTAKSKLESALTSTSLFNQLSQASICVVINDPDQPISLQAAKDSTGWTVSQMVDFCAGESNEDFIVQFPDYDSFAEIVDSPSPKNIAAGAISRDFEILPSKYVELGGNVQCDSTFNANFCSAAKTMATSSQLIDADLSCCIDTLTSADKKLLETHLQEGQYKDELKVLEQPSGGILGLGSMTTIIGLGGAVLLLLIIIVAVVMKGHAKPADLPKSRPFAGLPGMQPSAQGMQTMQPMQPMPSMQPMQRMPVEKPEITELRNYVVQAMGQGYAPEDIRTHLLQIGWDSGTADKVIGEAYQALQQAQ